MKSKRTFKEQGVSEVLKVFIAQNNLSVGLDKLDVVASWKRMMGSGLLNYTDSVEFNKGVLIVRLNSSVMREELTHNHSKIVSQLNENLGRDLVERILFL